MSERTGLEARPTGTVFARHPGGGARVNATVTGGVRTAVGRHVDLVLGALQAKSLVVQLARIAAGAPLPAGARDEASDLAAAGWLRDLAANIERRHVEKSR